MWHLNKKTKKPKKKQKKLGGMKVMFYKIKSYVMGNVLQSSVILLTVAKFFSRKDCYTVPVIIRQFKSKEVLYRNVKGHSWFEIFGRLAEVDGVG